MTKLRSLPMRIGSSLLFAASLVAFSGCEQGDNVIDNENPGSGVEMDQDPATGDTDVDVNTNDDDPNQVNP